jgi:hypothetical protein
MKWTPLALRQRPGEFVTLSRSPSRSFVSFLLPTKPWGDMIAFPLILRMSL